MFGYFLWYFILECTTVIRVKSINFMYINFKQPSLVVSRLSGKHPLPKVLLTSFGPMRPTKMCIQPWWPIWPAWLTITCGAARICCLSGLRQQGEGLFYCWDLNFYGKTSSTVAAK